MAERTLTLDVVTPERVVLSDEATTVSAPGVMGSFGVLLNHAPLLTELETGELNYRKPSGEQVRLAVSGGFMQIFRNQVSVLADSAMKADEIDVETVRAERDEARTELTHQPDPDRRAHLERLVRRAENQLKVAGR